MYNNREIVGGNTLAYDCLDYHGQHRTKLVNQDLYDMTIELISFCIRPVRPSDEPVDTFVHPLARRLSFERVSDMGVTVEQLLSWSIPTVIVERYQRYLSSHKVAPLNEQFYNCTSARFGLRCQYSFGSRFIQGMSFDDLIDDTFHSKQSYATSWDDMTTLAAPIPCYVLIKCHRNGIEWCLDWREICDGVVDCFDEGTDEEHCFALEINKCKADEYRCHNGMCIAEDLWQDGEDGSEVDCLDRSDEVQDEASLTMCYRDVSFRCEQQACRPNELRFSCGDGECVGKFTPCHSGRHQLLIESMMQEGDLNKECWMTMVCLTKLVKQLNGTPCDVWLSDDFISAHLAQCPRLFQFPTTAVHSNHVLFFYADVQTRENLTNDFMPDYMCYNAELCEFHSVHWLSDDNLTCLSKWDMWIEWDNTVEDPWSQLVWSVEREFRPCMVSTNDAFRNQMLDSNDSTLYQCSNSLKVISSHRIKDALYDCIENDDEARANSCSFNDRYRARCEHENECWSPLMKQSACRGSDEQSEDILPFASFCDGISQYYYHSANREKRDDEDGCDMNALCDNMYSRCDGFWACPDGRDEWNCNNHSLCPAASHACISPYNYTVSCLSADRVNDGVADCLGATDEQEKCRFTFRLHHDLRPLSCLGNDECLRSSQFCDNRVDCSRHSDDEQFCQDRPFTCNQTVSHERNPLEHILCSLDEENEHRIKFFSVITSTLYPASTESSDHHDRVYYRQVEKNNELKDAMKVMAKRTFTREDQRWSHYCNRGIMIEKQSKNITSFDCLCSASYYGDRCQYQSQRVSLSLQLTSTSRYETYAVVILLVDDQHNEITAFSQFKYIAKDSCTMKWHGVLLYPTRPMNSSTNYSVRIDVVEKNSMDYVSHWYYSIPFVFLPVNQLSVTLNLSSSAIIGKVECGMKCLDGKQECMVYVNVKNKSFCRWKPSETIDDECSSGSVFIGWTQNRRPICVCPFFRHGPTCALMSSQCSPNLCQNQGQCVEHDESLFGRKYTCVCTGKYYGLNCEHEKWQLDVSFEGIDVSSYVIAHFYTISNDSQPQKTILLRKLTLFQQVVTFHISIPFHLVFIQINERDFYLVYLQHSLPMHAFTQLSDKQRCHPMSNYVNSTVLKLHQYERIAHFHRVCLQNWQIVCFVDEMYLCLCTNDHHANCLPFEQQLYSSADRFRCSTTDRYCLNGGECYQDHAHCPSTKICLCASCFFGQQCQLYAKGLGSTLDEILGYEFVAMRSLTSQSVSIKLSAAITMVIFVVGIINVILALMTFSQPKIREVGCGLYLLASSITSLSTVIFFTLKFWLLHFSYQNVFNAGIILTINCRFVEVMLKLSLFIDNWLNACIAMEKTNSVIQGLQFNKRKSRQLARRVTPFVFVGNVAMLVPQMLNLHVFEDKMEGRSWCVIHYKPWLKRYTVGLTFFNYFGPFVVQIGSIILIIIGTAYQKLLIQSNENRIWSHLRWKIVKYRRLMISQMIITLLTLPHLIISLKLECRRSSDLLWFFLVGYFVSFLPAASIVIIFVTPSPLYRKQLKQGVKRIWRRAQYQWETLRTKAMIN
ncbi:unnamed protein product [Adineta ricciae]|uniref:Uncharacterized protein n=2 Tax=Adineta ricciae TaxID=249248 RepID=A0A814VT74_ADIRI|nr:unnamed protein product [Adineta ricciae]